MLFVNFTSLNFVNVVNVFFDVTWKMRQSLNLGKIVNFKIYVEFYRNSMVRTSREFIKLYDMVSNSKS